MKNCFLLIIAIVGCHASLSKSSKDSTQSKKNSSADEVIKIIEPDTALNTFRIHFPLREIGVTFGGALDSPQKKQTYIFYAKKGQTLDAEIVPDTSMANIRFNQIFIPDGSSDGPFGQEIHYPLKETGDYRLIIAESLMGESWKGKYLVHLKIK